MITIGNHVRITEGVKILTHDYSWSVLKRMNIDGNAGNILGASGKVVIGNNVFIGMNSIITRCVSIGNNVIIGAGSVVSKNCESNFVYAGVPAKKIMSIEDFYNKRKSLQVSEAKNLALAYKERFGKFPPEEIFHEYFMIFKNNQNLEDIFIDKMKLCNNFDESINYLENKDTEFNSFEEFLDFCFKTN